ncbi:MAG: GSCFA domain-containing protein [Porphyromonas sp.]|nr:GSCFA domain-containing protein [Porphyromonas sp.]
MYSKEIEVKHTGRKWGMDDRIMVWGSCFATELYARLYSELFNVQDSPYGVMYNPLSLAEGVSRLLDGCKPSEEELFYHLGEWHSPLHHGSYSHADKAIALQRMQERWESARDHIRALGLLVVTFGTSYVYELAGEAQSVVNNCHRLPSERFERRRLSVSEIVESWVPLVERLRGTMREGAQVVFTVSPICHYRDGAHESRLSKAVLLLAIEEILAQVGGLYFPAYEIQLDELRDYRFFKDDFAHPTSHAVDHILGKFMAAYIEEPSYMTRWSRLRKMLDHKPMTTNIEVRRSYYEELQNRLLEMQEVRRHPYLTAQIERVERLLQQD